MAVAEADLIAGFYEAAFDGTRFPAVLRDFGAFVDGIGAVLMLWDKQAQRPALLATAGHTGADAPEAYRRHYGALDPFRPVIAGLPTDTWTTSTAHFDDRFVAHDVFFNEYLLPRGIRYMASARVVAGPRFDAFLGVHRAPRQTPFSSDEVARLGHVGRHLGRAVRAFLELSDARLAHQAATAVANHSATPALLVDAGARVLFANPAAEALLARAPSLGTRGGSVVAARDADDRRLQRLIDTAVTAGAGGEMLIRQDAAQSIGVLVIPAGPLPTLYDLAPVPAALVLLDDWARRATPSTYGLGLRFGLTDSEAALARGLIDGKRLSEIAAARHVSVETVRTQLRSLFRKTGATRQADLLRILLARSAPAPGSDAPA